MLICLMPLTMMNIFCAASQIIVILNHAVGVIISLCFRLQSGTEWCPVWPLGGEHASFWLWSKSHCFVPFPAFLLLLFSHSVVSESCDPMDCSPSGSSVHGILQTRTLEWVAIRFFRGIFLIQGANLGFWQCRWILNSLSPLKMYLKNMWAFDGL